MADPERLYRTMPSAMLEQRLTDAALASEERQVIEKELRRREQVARGVGTLRRKPRYRSKPQGPPRWWQGRACMYVWVYAVPLIGMGIWSYFQWKGPPRNYHLYDNIDPLDPTLASYYLALFAMPFSLMPLLMMGAYLIRPRPATAVLSFLGTVAWCFIGQLLSQLG